MENDKLKKICIITGGAGGIGYQLSEGFNKKGYKVVVLDIKKQKELSKDIDFIKVDLRLENEIKYAFSQVIEKYGTAHILINNGAISNFNKSIEDISINEFDDVINVNLRGSFICCKEFIKANKKQNYGRIINIASTRWNQNEANWEAYGASKGGLISMTNTLAISLSKTPITVNAISPGWIQVDNYEDLTETDHSQHPSGRVGIPRDILNACLFLANPENDFINAANLVIDGGMTKKMIYE
ncbi:SDR family oxidoreductase [Cetobacterium somerae]|uniref:SDR family oxidoreductase n=1 Tax=Cetobacterium somerae TaxID=188913 RepID=UPI00211ED29C|nr:SDR family oxidoreductase [Cetobacterium somerae]MCQ9627226.1 SDR family oxidoreductase [Cetobacterium somerae]WVJ01636.1 SDR family oxidoreductase [Cetobacterium somerae]